MGVERDTRAFSESADLLQRPMQMRAGLRMDRDDVGASVRKRLNIFLRFDNHEVNVDRVFRRSSDGFDDRGANRDVRHKTAVHDIDVDPVGSRLVHGLDFSLQKAKISRKNGRGDSKGLW